MAVSPTTRSALSRPGGRADAPSFLRTPGLELILFGGKGGTGKTTCAAAAALDLAARSPDRRFLAVSIDPAHSLGDAMDGQPPPANLELLEIDSRECFRKFKEAHAQRLRQVALRGTFLDNDDVTQLLDLSMPGLDEVMAFDEISVLVERRAYTCIVVDTAPTGHTLRFFELPQVLRKWLGVVDAMLAKHHYMAKLYRGSYRRDDTDLFLERLGESTDRLSSVLSAPGRCLFVPVMLAEPLSVNETGRLVRRLEQRGVPVADILVNRLYPLTDRCPTCRDIGGLQRAELRRLVREFSGHALWEVPIQGAEVRGVRALSEFWAGVRPLEGPSAGAPAVAASPVRVDGRAALPGPEVRLVLFAGKGGVGKTTLASATALRLAEAYPEKRLHLISTDPARSLSDCLDVPLGPEGTRITGRLTAMEVDAEAEFAALREQYAEEVAEFFDRLLADQGLVDLEFEREALERMLDLVPPGLDELMALARVVSLLEPGRDDLLVLDTAPTGHFVRLLELPGLIQDWLQVMFGILLKYKNVFWLPRTFDFLLAMSKKVKRLRSLLADPCASRLHGVSIATEMALEETRDLVQACGRLGVRMPRLFLNQASPPGRCPACLARSEAESRVRRRFRETFPDIPQSVVYWCGERRGVARLSELGRELYDA
jgi:arsenite-transporting ATPase